MKANKYNITVTKSDITKGKPSDCSGCPIAIAVRRRFRAYKKTVLVDGYTVAVGSKSFSLPTKASNFIRNFDYSLKVKPFTFTLTNAQQTS